MQQFIIIYIGSKQNLFLINNLKIVFFGIIWWVCKNIADECNLFCQS